MSTNVYLDEREAELWLAYRRMNRTVQAAIAADLINDSGLSESDYDVLSNLSEVKARNGRILAVATAGDHEIGGVADDVIIVPDCALELQPILTVIPLQLFSYYVADQKGTDVDQPRNLAKSVTVE